MNTDHELDWLSEHRPDPDAPSPEHTARARAALITHGIDRRRRARRRTSALSGGTVAIAAGVAAFLALGGGGGGGGRAPGAPRPPALIHVSPPAPGGTPTPLAQFASYVQRLPMPHQPGNATLVVRDTVVDGSHRAEDAVYGGYDLYTDAGHYYYAPLSLAQLQQEYDTHQVSDGGGDEAKALRTIAAVAAGTPAQARAAVLDTEARDGPPPTPAETRRFLRQMPKRDRKLFGAAARHPNLRLP